MRLALNRTVSMEGAVLFRGSLPPRLEEFADLARSGFTIEPASPTDGAAWSATLRHPKWGTAEAVCPRQPTPPPRELLAWLPYLDDEDREAIGSSRACVWLKVDAERGHLLRDRKRLLGLARGLMADDGVALFDALSGLYWMPWRLEEELAHDADLDVEALYSIHVVNDGPEDDPSGQRCIWMHTHGLGELGLIDLDILRPHETVTQTPEVMRSLAFMVLEGAKAGDVLELSSAGGPVELVEAATFQRRAHPADAALRSDPNGEHVAQRVVLCEPRRRGLLGAWFHRPRPVRWLTRELPEPTVFAFPNAATALMAERARLTVDLLRRYAEEFAEFEPTVLVKLGYPVDGGGPDDCEHLWFEVHRLGPDRVEATLINQPFNIAAMQAGDRGEHGLDRLTDWAIFTPAGSINPRNVHPVRLLRTHRESILEAMRQADGPAAPREPPRPLEGRFLFGYGWDMGDGPEYADALPNGPLRGRGAGLNPGNRFESLRLHVLGEHLDRKVAAASAGEGAGRPGTVVLDDRSRSVLNPVDSPDLSMRWSINPYRGCEHGCIYCYARPTHETLGLSSGLDFETRILAKRDAPALLRRELARPGWRAEPVMMSGATDPYQPVERALRITRGCLEVFAECRQPVGIVTKSRMVLRDLDLLSELARHGAVSVAVSLTTLDRELAMKMEPRAASPADRLRVIRALSDAGVPTKVMVAPIVPGLTDREVPAILEAAAEAGARSAGWVLLRLPYQIKALFLDWLQRHFPERAGHVESLVRSTRDGKLYDSTWRVRQRGTGPVAAQVGQVFRVFARRHGLDGTMPGLSSDAFRKPMLNGQMRLFG